MPALDGSTHINLTVSDIDRSTEWYQRVFGFRIVNDVRPPESGFRFRTMLEPTSMASIVLGQPDEPDPEPSSEFRNGLHHLGYHVASLDELDRWSAHLDEIGVEHSGILKSEHEAGSQIWFRDPDNIWLEVYWMNRAFFMNRLREQWREARQSGDPSSWMPTGA